jgi:hypothetical protein
MIAQHREAVDIDDKQGGQLFQPLLHPIFAVLERLARERVRLPKKARHTQRATQ